MSAKSSGFKSDFVKIDALPAAPDDELPEVSDDMLDRAVFSVGSMVLPTPKKRGRPAGSAKTVSTTIRVDADVLACFHATGKGWQRRINEALREWLKTHSPV